MISSDGYDQLHRAVEVLAGVCDYASTEDGIGYNSRDTSFGHSLASQKRWSYRQAAAAHRMLQKYKGQLQRYGIDYGTIPKPSEGDNIIHRTIELEGDLFYITSEPNYQLNNQIQGLLGRRWNPDLNKWTVPFSSGVSVLAFAEKNNFTLGPGVREAIEQVQEQRDHSIAGSYAKETEGFNVSINGDPRPYQLAGAKYLVEKERSFLGDPTGLGKTLSALLALKHEDAFPVLVVCPKSAKTVWARETKKWLGIETIQLTGRPKADTVGDLDYLINAETTKTDQKTGDDWLIQGALDDSFEPSVSRNKVELRLKLGGAAKLVERPKVVICNYDILKDWAPVLAKVPFKAIIGDESHRLKNGKAQRTKAFKTLAKGIRYRWLLSATPSLNRIYEWWSQISILGRERDFGGYNYFVQHFCNAGYNGYGMDLSGSSNEAEFNELLRMNCYIRREVEEVASELPDLQRNVLYLDINNWPDVRKALDDIISFVGEEARNDMEFRSSISHLPEPEQSTLIHQYAVSKEAAAARAEFLVRIAKLKYLVAKGKIPAIIDWIDGFVENKEKLLVFGWHEEIIKELAAHYKAGYITGSVSQTKRDEIIDRFQNDDDNLLIFLNLRAGGESITLTGTKDRPCRNVGFAELDWSPMVHKQAVGRIRRLGTTADFLTVHYLLGEGTIDEENYDMLQDKEQSVTIATTGNTDVIENTAVVARLKNWIMAQDGN